MNSVLMAKPLSDREAATLIQRATDAAVPWLVKAGVRLLVAAVIIFVGLKVIRWIRKGAERSMTKAGIEVTLYKFLDALMYAVLLGILVFIVAEELGLSPSSLVTFAGAVTLALSLALQNTLANFAGGVLILMLKPFKVGDYIVSQDGEGTVESIGLVYTTLSTLENKKISIPNNTLANSPLTNVTGSDTRRLVIPVNISYQADLKKAKAVLTGLFEESPHILKEEGILVIVDSLTVNGVVLSARGWTATDDYWQAKWDLTEAIKLTFDTEGIEIPYSSLNLYMQQQNGQESR